MSGKDGASLTGRIMTEELGFVGEVTQVNADVMNSLVHSGYIPGERGSSCRRRGDWADPHPCTSLSSFWRCFFLLPPSSSLLLMFLLLLPLL